MAKATIRQQTTRHASRTKVKMKRRETLRRRCGIVGGSVIALLLIGGGWQFFAEGGPSVLGEAMGGARNAVTAKAGFKLRQIDLEGRSKTDKSALMSAIGLPQGESIFAESPETIRERLEKIATIRKATVSRVLPDKLHIALEERKPIAVWQKRGKLHVVDADGMVLESESPEKYRNLLVVVGDDAAGKLPELFSLLTSEPAITPQVVAAVRVGGRRWDLRLKNQVKVMLPEEEPAEALHRLAEWQEQQQVLEKAVTAIDFRLKERTFLKVIPEPKADGKGKLPSQEI